MLSLRTRLPLPVYPVSLRIPFINGLPTVKSPLIGGGVIFQAIHRGRSPLVG
jgi:hypothetical protein